MYGYLLMIILGANEVQEGVGLVGLGSTSFVAAVWMLSARAGKDFSSLVRGLFVGRLDLASRLKYGAHSVNLFVHGKWRVHTIDDLLPVDKHSKLIFTCGTDMQVCIAVCCSVLQCVAVYCSVLQCVVVCCSVMQSH